MERAREASRAAARGRAAARAAAGPGTGGTLTLAAAPIGRPQDASPRLAAALAAAPVVAAEDTHRVRRLASALGVRVSGRVVSYWDEVEAARVPALLAELTAGRDVLLITDAGMPGVSDPGYRLVAAAAAAGIRVTVMPGPSAVTAALAVSGLPSDRFCFEGFPPRGTEARARRFAGLAGEPRTLVFFESRHRLAATLAALASSFGPGRAAVVCRELTKTHEEVRRGTLAELAAWAETGPLGEITIVVAGAPPRRADPEQAAPEAAAAVAAREREGVPRKAAIAEVARELGLRKREVYDAVLRYRAGGPDESGR
jgi:16S rRNA (cytidine1402-2'-O)-methyltransferase